MRNFFIGLGVILGISLSIVGLKYLTTAEQFYAPRELYVDPRYGQ